MIMRDLFLLPKIYICIFFVFNLSAIYAQREPPVYPPQPPIVYDDYNKIPKDLGDLTVTDAFPSNHAFDCSLENACTPTETFMPVWKFDAGTKQITECISPLHVRQDQYTNEKVIKPQGLTDYDSKFIDPEKSCNIGFVGVNRMNPEEQLHVNGSVRADYGEFIGNIRLSKITNQSTLGVDQFGNPMNPEPILVDGDMNVNGTMTAGVLSSNHISANYLRANGFDIFGGALKVKNAQNQNVFAVYQDGSVRARKTTVDLQPIPDYVFKEGYNLMKLDELESFITENKHLPNIKSEAEYQKEGGIDLGELNVKLLEKVEELTLYTIQQQKQIDELKKLVHEMIKK
jgi:hypothetical protein